MNYSILRDGNLAILGTDIDPSTGWQGRADIIPLKLAAEAEVRIWVFDGEKLTDGPSFPMLQPSLTVDRFSNGQWIVVSHRTLGEANGRILSPEGKLLGSLLLGDGINHAQVDDLDRIWIGWFDEGIFGNRAWQIAGHDWPPSSYGVVCFDKRGALLQHANQGPSQGGIADTYALNVAGEAAWACTYTDFPILNLGSGPARWWRTSLIGSKAIAVAGDLILAAGGYGNDANLAVVLRLEDASATELGRWRLPFPVAPEQPAPNLMEGRGDTLHIVEGGLWQRWRVADFTVICTSG